jgi:hypothetical protein
MGLNINKAEKVIGVTSLIVIAGFFAVFTHINKKSNFRSDLSPDLKIDYNMARPEEPFTEFSISGREIDRHHEGLSDDAEKALNLKKKELLEKKHAEVQKKEAIKKKLDEQKKKQAQLKATQERVKKIQAKQMETLAEKNRLSESVRGAQRQESGAAPVYYTTQNGPGDLAQQPNLKSKKSFAEWRELIFSNPTSESIAVFISAFRKSEVTEGEIQAMAQELLNDQDQNLKGLGLMMLRSAPSVASLSQLVKVEATLPESYQSYIEQTYVAYLFPQNLTYLSGALQSRDRQLVARVLNTLNIYLGRLSQGDNSAFFDPRNRRSGSIANVTMSSYSALVPALNSILNAQDNELKQLAEQVVSYIKSSNNIAQTAYDTFQ